MANIGDKIRFYADDVDENDENAEYREATVIAEGRGSLTVRFDDDNTIKYVRNPASQTSETTEDRPSEDKPKEEEEKPDEPAAESDPEPEPEPKAEE